MSANTTGEVELLQQLLADDWHDVLDATAEQPLDGFVTVASEELDTGRWSRFMRVITHGPSGQHYAWEYAQGLTEYQDDTGPCEYGAVAVKPVHAVRQTVTKWAES
ncbi:hypothetical protein [Nocardia colli]|uniref:hypothetical protein n=1 Tax=Nocardia colli TaxID=2545717 RepID=UPI0035D97316